MQGNVMIFPKSMTFTLLPFLYFYTPAGYCENAGFLKNSYNNFKHNVKETWRDADEKDIYVPVLTWHNRYAYDEKHLDKYNEKPWGLGGGISRFDEKHNWNGLYFMAFKDSFNHWEPIGGYGWEKIWRPLENIQDFRLGAGYTAFITLREKWNYIPVPAILPLASIGYKNVNLQATYIPGTRNNGNVLFCWLRFNF